MAAPIACGVYLSLASDAGMLHLQQLGVGSTPSTFCLLAATSRASPIQLAADGEHALVARRSAPDQPE